MLLDLTDDEKDALIGILAGLIESNHFPQSERVQLLRRILAKFRAQTANPQPNQNEQ